MDIYLEIFGYIGTVLVVISMLMTSVVRLRVINMCGGIISTVYSIFCNAWPIVVMNVILIMINFCQVIIYYKNVGNLTAVSIDKSNGDLIDHLCSRSFASDIRDLLVDSDAVYAVMSDSELAALTTGEVRGNVFSVTALAVSPKYKSSPILATLLGRLSLEGITYLNVDSRGKIWGTSGLKTVENNGNLVLTLQEARTPESEKNTRNAYKAKSDT
ncbi:MAG: hypothetical protein IJY69_03140 [Clostridia bacterium]|nr:hypothetical protein [Clostridia bacterium]